VYAQTASFNKNSIKLLESLEFKLDGTLRQHHYYKGDLYDDLLYSLLKFEYGPPD
jgi:RimJ/RimL family protein N-acetyltransferase